MACGVPLNTNRYGMIDPDLKDKEGLPLTCRAVFIIGENCLTCLF
jgi:hypothetical protein